MLFRSVSQSRYVSKTPCIVANTTTAGIAWSFKDNWEERAFKNIYKALDRLISLGLPKDTPVLISTDEGKLIRTTAKFDKPGDLTKWDESKHPRDDEGKWTDKGTGTAGVTREIPQFKIKLHDWGGEADADDQGIIGINTKKWQALSTDRVREAVMTHEIIHQTIGEDMLDEYLKDHTYMDEVADMLTIEVDKDGFKIFAWVS